MAERCGPDFNRVLAQPFALTLYAWQQLQERDRIRRLRDRERDIYNGQLIAMAFNEPKRIEDERSDNVSDMRTPAHSNAAKATQSLVERGLALAERIERERVLENGA